MSGLIYKCRNCDKEFSPQGIKNHETKCLPTYTPRTDMPESLALGPFSSYEPPSARFEFPKMLYTMLEDCTFDEDLYKIVSWQPHGLAFKVHNREEMEKILPRWFREKYESWRCLLEQWGFLKLSRGKDRGCWYQKNFIHRSSFLNSKNMYEKIPKKKFLDGNPDYLSPREEPDLDKLSTLDNRISPKQRKRKAIASQDSIENKNAKVEKATNNSLPNKNMIDSKDKIKDKIKNTNNTSISRYATSHIKKCRYCDGQFMPQGIGKHEKSCAMRIDIESEEEEEAPPDSTKCRFCNKFFSKYGIKNHEMACMRVIDAEKKSNNDDEDKIMDPDDAHVPQDMVPCKYCGKFWSKYGLKTHEKFCNIDGSKNGQKINNMKKSGKKNNRESTLSDDSSVTSTESGCQVCGFDDDHANLLLCEGCETELHTYCLNPPLEKVPEGDWFCDSCSNRTKKAEENLGKLIHRVPSEMMERFGEICFAKSAENAHWWPALIFDPRSFLHNAEVVELARRNLGKRYLVFFFENQDAFAAIPKTWIMSWEDGIEKEFDKGRCVRHASKNRRHQFQRAMDAAKAAFEDDPAIITDSPTKSKSNGMEFDSQMHDDSEERSFLQQNEFVLCSICGKEGEEFQTSISSNNDWQCSSCQGSARGSRNRTSSSIRNISNEVSEVKELSTEEWILIKEEVLKEVEETSPSRYPELIDKELLKGVTMKSSGKWQSQPFIDGKLRYVGMFQDKRKAAFAAQLVRNKIPSSASATIDHDNANSDPVPKSSVPFPTSTALSFKHHSSKHESDFGSFIDKKPSRSKKRSAVTMTQKTQVNNEIVHSLQQSRQESPEKKRLQEKAEEKRKLQLRSPPQHLQEHERNELLLSASFCNYYVLPLSEM
mmetsp:Transcript_36862/g.41174  ORF Transcript_36862/g.41174 Transcript_36862/m.41174 type:complete len:880 (+) Transcript_36862:49-2688(+)